jgi:hypothetical protein
MLFLGIGHPPTPLKPVQTFNKISETWVLQTRTRRDPRTTTVTLHIPPRPWNPKIREKNVRKTGFRDPSQGSPLPNRVRLRRRLLEVLRQPILESSCKTRCLPQPQRTKEKPALAKGMEKVQRAQRSDRETRDTPCIVRKPGTPLPTPNSSPATEFPLSPTSPSTHP